MLNVGAIRPAILHPYSWVFSGHGEILYHGNNQSQWGHHFQVPTPDDQI